MTLSNLVKFECGECGSRELGYQKYAKCVTPATIKDDGQMEYGLSEFDEDDYLYANNGFICMNCKGPVKHCGFRFETERQLLNYLAIDPVQRDKEQQEYVKDLDARMANIPDFDDDLDLIK